MNTGEDAPFLYDDRPGGLREVRAVVVDHGDGPPTICTEGSTDSDPPLCTGVELANWSWDRVDGEIVTGGVPWGTFHFVGLVGGGRFDVVGFLP